MVMLHILIKILHGNNISAKYLKIMLNVTHDYHAKCRTQRGDAELNGGNLVTPGDGAIITNFSHFQINKAIEFFL